MKNEIYLKAGRVELSREEVEELQETNRVYILRKTAAAAEIGKHLQHSQRRL